jgi:hypothetical protein
MECPRSGKVRKKVGYSDAESHRSANKYWHLQITFLIAHEDNDVGEHHLLAIEMKDD